MYTHTFGYSLAMKKNETYILQHACTLKYLARGKKHLERPHTA